MSSSNVILYRIEEATCKSDLQVRTEGATVKDHLTVQAQEQWPALRTITIDERPLLNGNGRISHDAMKRITDDRKDMFDRQRKPQNAIAAEVADMEELKSIEAKLSKTRKESGR